jgi:hypothetical protein
VYGLRTAQSELLYNELHNFGEAPMFQFSRKSLISFFKGTFSRKTFSDYLVKYQIWSKLMATTLRKTIHDEKNISENLKQK